MGRLPLEKIRPLFALLVGGLATAGLVCVAWVTGAPLRFVFAQPASAAGPAPEYISPPSSDPQDTLAFARPLTPTLQTYSQYLPFVAHKFPPPLGDLSSGWYLMVDDEHIAARDLPRQYHAFEKYPGNPIMRANKPWEGRAIQLYGSVYEGFRMWYSSYNKDWHSGQVLYAESADGIHWRKPNLPGAENNALFDGRKANLVSVMHTPADLSNPFKLVAYQNQAFWGYTSADGLRTVPVSDAPVWSSGHDVAHFSWNATDQRYYGAAKDPVLINGNVRRSVRLISSDDFIHWTSQSNRLTPDAIDDQLSPGAYVHFYGMPTFNLGEQRLGLLWILKSRDSAGLYGPVTIQYVSSHDGVAWVRQEGPRTPILGLGAPGSWDSGQVYTASQPIKVGGELWLYYSGCNLEHGGRLTDMVCSIGLARLPYLRVASLYGTGTILTKPLTPTGDNLTINYSAVGGEIRAELQRDGAPIPGYEAENSLPLNGDSLDAALKWKDQTGLPDGPLQVKFILRSATLYAFALSD